MVPGRAEARVVKNAEEYYRTMYRGNVESWNLRDQHMAETVRLLRHLEPASGGARSSSGSQFTSRRCPRHRARPAGRAERRPAHARAARDGRLPARVHHLRERSLRPSEWGAPAERKRVRRALPGSYESLFPSHRDAAFRRLDLRSSEKRRAPCGPRSSGHRRAVPAGDRAAGATTSARSCPGNAIRDPPRRHPGVEPLERMPLWEAGNGGDVSTGL